MKEIREIYRKLRESPNNIRFEEICKAAEVFGFIYRDGKGSHRIFNRKGIKEMLNFQNVKGKAKCYQIKQLIKIIDRYNLLDDDKNV